MALIENFLKNFNSENTKIAYKWALYQFFKNVYKDFKEEEIENFAENYIKTRKIEEIEKDIENFFASIKDEPPKSIKLQLAAIKSFLLENNIELKEIFWRRIRRRIKGSRALTIDIVPNINELKKILMNTNIQGRALFFLLASSGMRIGEALKLKLNDIDLDNDPAKINIRGEYTKSGNPRIAFISKEAKEHLLEWLKQRGNYLEVAVKRSKIFAKNPNDDRIFPFEETTAYSLWKNALKKSGLYKKDSSTNRLVIHPHVLRKFFRTKMATLIPIDVVEALMGHEGYLTEVYRRYSIEELGNFYKKGEPAITIFPNIETNEKVIKELEEKNKELQDLVNKLTKENLELKEKIAFLEKEKPYEEPIKEKENDTQVSIKKEEQKEEVKDETQVSTKVEIEK
ncbi:MAG: site-specific integrase, partial [Candidatus Micrarchaeia archaeon]